jgi:hypothetical protein
MKRLLLIGLLILAPAAFGASSVLTSRGLWYSIEKPNEGTSVLLMRRSGGTKVMIDVPATLDGGRNYRAQLDYDRANDRLYVTWVREGANSSDVMMSWLDATGEWSDELVLASAPGLVGRDGLRTALTRVGSGTTRTTLIHVASWVRDGEALRGEYLLVAFESGSHVSTSAANFQTLDTSASGSNYGDDLDVFAPYPALAMAALGDGVDVVYGNEHGTSVTRLHISPRLDPNARMWKPVGRNSGSMPPARFAATSVSPVRAFFSRDRVVLYTNDRTFRFVVFESGSWSETQEFTLDEGLTGEALLNQIRRMIEEESPDLVTTSK